MQAVKYQYQVKENGAWTTRYESTEPAAVYQGLASCMVAKKLDECLWIKRIVVKRDGSETRTIIFYEGNGNRRVYEVPR